MNSQPLKNRRIVITRPRFQSPEEISRLEDLGAEVIPLPVIKIEQVKDKKLEDLFESGGIDYIVFSSVNGARETASRIGADTVNKFEVAAVGSKTREFCENNGINVSFMPEEYSASGLLKEFSGMDIKGKRFLLPTSAIARDELREGLASLGALVYSVPVYDTTLPRREELAGELDGLRNNGADVFIFTSPSTFRNFLKLAEITDPGKYFENKVVAAIGPTTKEAIEQNGVKVTLTPEKYTIDNIVDKILEFYSELQERKIEQ